MSKRTALGLALSLVGVAGCPKTGDGLGQPAASQSSAPAVTVAPPPAATTPPPPTPDAALPVAGDEVIGTLGTSKGFASLGGVLLRRSEVKAQLGQDWRKFLGRRVVARGRRHDYSCGPNEQCLISGVIPLLTDLTSMEPCRTTVSASDASGVECPLSEAEVERCLESCKRDSRACDKSAGKRRGALRRCGCSWISCKRGCKADGVALFKCR